MPKRATEATTDGGPLSIGALARATRIPVATLRTWERRYGAPRPERKPSGHRVYPAASVPHLRRVERLLTLGHRPAEILSLSLHELDALLALAEPRGAGVSAFEATAPDEPQGATIERMLRATRAYDRARLLHELRVQWTRLGPLGFLARCAGAFMTEVGRAWHEGSLEVRHEHFASACLSDFLRAVREPWDHEARGPRIVAAMLPGEAHEGGLLMVSALLAMRGWRVLYLGADTPVEQIVEAARVPGIEAVAVSVSSAMPRPRAVRALAGLRRALPPRMPTWVGGAGAPPTVRGTERFESLAALDRRLLARV